MQDYSHKQRTDMANAIRALSADAIEKAQSGHPGLPLGMADLATALFCNLMRFNPKDPSWHNRDRFILSAGHGSMLLYSIMHLLGYEDISMEDIKNFRQLHSPACGHPEYGKARGIETTTGPLGQGIANAVGMAISESILRNRYGKDVCDHMTVALVGDGCLMEGISQEAISIAGHLGLGNLLCIFDNNSISIDGSTNLTCSTDMRKRFESENWEVISCDSHDLDSIDAAIKSINDNRYKEKDRPTLLIASSIIGKYAGSKEGTNKAHGSPLGLQDIDILKKNIKWESEPFQIPEEALGLWRNIPLKHKEYYEESKKALEKNASLKNLLSGEFDHEALNKALHELKKNAPKDPIATRKSSKLTLEVLVKHIPQLIGGSADLTSSNLTLVNGQAGLSRENKSGNYIYYGTREHAMGAIMNGISLHGAFVPYAGTFLIFIDYMKPAIRLSALMRQKVIYVCTHDSIGLGEDGPTHQPIEHLDSLRSIPDLMVFRPADFIETVECWELAVKSDLPSAISLTRQSVPLLRNESTISEKNVCAIGGYEIYNNHSELENSQKNSDEKLTILSTGSEVSLGIDTAKLLKVPCRVISIPCHELFLQLPKQKQEEILGKEKRVIIEASSCNNLKIHMREGDMCFSLNSFGESAPYKDLYDFFGFTSDKLANKIEKELLNKI